MKKVLILTAVLMLATTSVGCHNWKCFGRRGTAYRPWAPAAACCDPCATAPTTTVPGCTTCTGTGTTTIGTPGPTMLPGPISQ